MMRLILVLAFLTSSLTSKAAQPEFSLLEGKDYYQWLGVSSSDNLATIKLAYRRLMMDNHPDKFSDADEARRATKLSQNINEAYAVLSDAQNRYRYDLWLGIASTESKKAAEDQERKRQIQLTSDYLIKEAINIRNENPGFTFVDFVSYGRTLVVYYVRYMPMSNYEASDLYAFIVNKGIEQFESGQIGEDALALIAGGALTYLNEIANYPGNFEYQASLKQIHDVLKTRLERDRYFPARRIAWDNLWKIVSRGQSYFPPQSQPRPQQAPSASCETSFTVTQGDVTYTIPIRIEIKIGR